MEDDAKDIKTPLLSKVSIEDEMERLQFAVDESQKRIDYTKAHDEQIVKAIRIVERLLRKNKRICYGGTAINALLPKEKQFYDPRFTIPDYDMFTPDVKGDVKSLIEDLKKEGFEEISERAGIHETTRKVMVNYVPIADFTAIHEVFYKEIKKRAHTVDGILYCDPDFLRMLMYLEMSRPRGFVDRWKKVYQRLLLLEQEYPIQRCTTVIDSPSVDRKIRESLLLLLIQRKRVCAGMETLDFYRNSSENVTLKGLSESKGVLVFFSPECETDSVDISSILGNGVKVEKKEAMEDDFYTVYFIRYHKKPIVLLIQEKACHSYVPVDVGKGLTMRMASLDLLMNLYLSFVVFGKKEERFLEIPVLCLAEQLHSLLLKYRKHPTEQVASFTVPCSGKQVGFESLKREREKRQKKEKEGMAASGRGETKQKGGVTRRVRGMRKRRSNVRLIRVTRRQSRV
jgi:hypothetical protein